MYQVPHRPWAAIVTHQPRSDTPSMLRCVRARITSRVCGMSAATSHIDKATKTGPVTATINTTHTIDPINDMRITFRSPLARTQVLVTTSSTPGTTRKLVTHTTLRPLSMPYVDQPETETISIPHVVEDTPAVPWRRMRIGCGQNCATVVTRVSAPITPSKVTTAVSEPACNSQV